MTEPDQQVKDLLTEAEYAIFDASLPENISSLDERGLQAEVGRARQARDKYRDLYRRQATTSRTRQRSRGAALMDNERTSRKAEIFEDVLTRLEDGLAERQRS